jgi:vacuolar-type H+-ATPase subunit E/Vma4
MTDIERASLDWLKLLGDELDARAVVYERCARYYAGHQGSRFVASGYRELFTQAFEHYRENICRVVVSTVEQRLDVDAFRFPSAGNPDETDKDAWQIWQDNGLDSLSQLGHLEAIKKGVSYVLVSPFASERVGPDKRSPRITVENPNATIVAFAPGGMTRIVGMKRWFDQLAERTYATLYFPDRIEKFQSSGRTWANQHGRGVIPDGGWEQRIVPGETWPLPHSLGEVPIVPLVNNRELGEGLFAGIEGSSDIADVMSIQDAINFIALNGIVASDKAAFPQKWATGVEIPTDPVTQKPKPGWAPDIDSLIWTRVPDAKFGNFDAAEIQQYDANIRGKLIYVAAMTQLPVGNFIPATGQPASGEAREAADIGLTKKAERKQRTFGDTWELALRLAFRQLADPRGDDTACETEWRSAAIEPAAAKIAALVQEVQTLHVPLAVAWRRAGYSATERAKFRAMLIFEETAANMPDNDSSGSAMLPAAGATPAQTTPVSPAPAAAPAAAVTPATGDADLGAGGQSALRAERQAARDATARAEAAETELKNLKAAGQSDQEKAIDEARKAASKETATGFQALIRSVRVEAALSAAGVDPQLLDLAVRADEFAKLKVTDEGSVEGLADAVDNFIPEIWANELLVNLRKDHVFGGPAVVNRDYEGQIRAAGDTVRINSIGAVTVSSYTKNTDISAPETLTDAQASAPRRPAEVLQLPGRRHRPRAADPQGHGGRDGRGELRPARLDRHVHRGPLHGRGLGEPDRLDGHAQDRRLDPRCLRVPRRTRRPARQRERPQRRPLRRRPAVVPRLPAPGPAVRRQRHDGERRRPPQRPDRPGGRVRHLQVEQRPEHDGHQVPDRRRSPDGLELRGADRLDRGVPPAGPLRGRREGPRRLRRQGRPAVGDGRPHRQQLVGGLTWRTQQRSPSPT